MTDGSLFPRNLRLTDDKNDSLGSSVIAVPFVDAIVDGEPFIAAVGMVSRTVIKKHNQEKLLISQRYRWCRFIRNQ